MTAIFDRLKPGCGLSQVVSNLVDNPKSTAKFVLYTAAASLFGVVMTNRCFNQSLKDITPSVRKKLINNANRYTLLSSLGLGLTLVSSLVIIFNAKVNLPNN